MKKSFLFAVLAAAFASCTNGDDVFGPETPDTDLQAINLTVTAPSQKGSRGTGTVGSVDGTGLDNAWQGQEINVFMFKKGTLELASLQDDPTHAPIYDNAPMLTPGSDITHVSAGVSGYAYRKDGEVRYYPLTGSYSFWGYRTDDAAINLKNGKQYRNENGNTVINFTMDGSQDIMAGKTVDDAEVITVAKANGVGDLEADRLYGAYAARRNVQPNLVFNHLLTRLTFQAKAGDDNASYIDKDGNKRELLVSNVKGSTVLPTEVLDPNDPEAKISAGVYIDKITVYSKTTGDLYVAYTAQDGAQGIQWNDAMSWLTLKKRAADDNSGNKNLVEMTPEYLKSTTTYQNLGEALMVAPSEEYRIKIYAHQYKEKYEQFVIDNGGGAISQEWRKVLMSFPQEIDVPINLKDLIDHTDPLAPRGYSFNIQLNVWGLEKITVSTQLTPWKNGGDYFYDMQ